MHLKIRLLKVMKFLFMYNWKCNVLFSNFEILVSENYLNWHQFSKILPQKLIFIIHILKLSLKLLKTIAADNPNDNSLINPIFGFEFFPKIFVKFSVHYGKNNNFHTFIKYTPCNYLTVFILIINHQKNWLIVAITKINYLL